MATSTKKLVEEIRSLPEMEKLHLVETILEDLDKPDPELDGVWAEEARKRWGAYLKDRSSGIDYAVVMGRYRQP